MGILKLLFFLFFIYLLHRLYLGFKLVKKIRDEVLIKGKTYKRYSYGFDPMKGHQQDGANPSSPDSSPKSGSGEAIEAEYRVIK